MKSSFGKTDDLVFKNVFLKQCFFMHIASNLLGSQKNMISKKIFALIYDL